MKNTGKIVSLQIYVAAYCSGCGEAQRLAGVVSGLAPEVAVEVVDISQPGAPVPPQVFATPTYILNNRVVSLGNPSLEHLCRLLGEAGVPV